MFVGSVGQGVTLFITGGLAKLAATNPDVAPKAAAGAAAMIFIYTWIFAQTWLNVAFILPAEIFPVEARTKGNAFGVAGWAIGSGWTSLIIPIMFTNLGEKALYVFGALNFASIPVAYCLYPETANHSLESINLLFASNSPFAWDQEREFQQRLMRSGLHEKARHGSHKDIENVYEKP